MGGEALHLPDAGGRVQSGGGPGARTGESRFPPALHHAVVGPAPDGGEAVGADAVDVPRHHVLPVLLRGQPVADHQLLQEILELSEGPKDKDKNDSSKKKEKEKENNNK